MRTFLLLLWALLLAAPVATPAMASTFQMQVSQAFQPGTVHFSEHGQVYEVRWRVIATSDDRIAVCGIGYFRQGDFQSTIQRMAQDGWLSIDGQRVPMDLSFFAQAATPGDLQRGTANCQVTAHSANGASQAGIGFAQGVHRN